MILYTSVSSNSLVEILHVCKSLNFLFRDLDDTWSLRVMQRFSLMSLDEFFNKKEVA